MVQHVTVFNQGEGIFKKAPADSPPSHGVKQLFPWQGEPAWTGGSFRGPHERTRREEHHVCAPEGGQGARTPLAGPSARLRSCLLVQQPAMGVSVRL